MVNSGGWMFGFSLHSNKATCWATCWATEHHESHQQQLLPSSTFSHQESSAEDGVSQTWDDSKGPLPLFSESNGPCGHWLGCSWDDLSLRLPNPLPCVGQLDKNWCHMLNLRRSTSCLRRRVQHQTWNMSNEQKQEDLLLWSHDVVCFIANCLNTAVTSTGSSAHTSPTFFFSGFLMETLWLHVWRGDGRLGQEVGSEMDVWGRKWDQVMVCGDDNNHHHTSADGTSTPVTTKPSEPSNHDLRGESHVTDRQIVNRLVFGSTAILFCYIIGEDIAQ